MDTSTLFGEQYMIVRLFFRRTRAGDELDDFSGMCTMNRSTIQVISKSFWPTPIYVFYSI